jgi:acetylornithine/succinyldiaminopimelate/putrescine aminotransferase
LGGGLPLGAFIASHQKMNQLTFNPVLGHISTFAGHPVCCAAGLAAFEELIKFAHINLQFAGQPASQTANCKLPTILEREQLFRRLLQHPSIKAIHGKGLLLAVEFESAELCQRICHACVQAGLITDWFLFAPNCLRIAPPLTVDTAQINNICSLLLEVIESQII